MPQKLPRYVFRRANGSYRYKRNVPVGLRKLLGKDTIYRQLGNSYKEAMSNLPLVHTRIEALFNDEGVQSAKQRSLQIIRGALGEGIADARKCGTPYKGLKVTHPFTLACHTWL